jgi:nitroreductase
MEILKVIGERRSVRKYKSDPVPDEILLEILEACRAAPSWANTQVCRYVVVKDQAVKEDLLGTVPEMNPARKGMVQAPVIICLVAKRGLSGFYKGAMSTDKGDWFMYDAGIAMEHLALAAWQFGLGTVHVGVFDAEKAEKVLNVAEGYSIVALTPLGYFENIPNATPRKPLSELVFLNRFGEPFTE